MSKSSFCKEYNAIDVLKLILAIFVMLIHSGIDKTIISPVLRIAVPLFFIISSYFFFSKNEKLPSNKEKKKALLHMAKRNLLLYLFWAIVQLPFLFFVRDYHRQLPRGVWYALKDILLGSGFTGSWYIVALVIGVAVVFLLSKKIPSVWLAVLMLPLYIMCCLLTNYYNLFDSDSFVSLIGNGYHELTGLYYHTGFPVALFWVSLGKVLAEKKPVIKTSALMISGVLFGALLALERYWILSLGSAASDDCYFALILICPVIFLLVSRNKLAFTTKFRIRELSVLIYVTHGCCGRVVGYLLKLLPFDFLGQEFVKIIITLFIVVIAGHFLIYLKDRRSVKLLKYAC